MHIKKILSTLVVLGSLFALPQAFAEEGMTAPMAPTGFVRFSQKGLGLILGGSTGGGWIHFQGDDHTFRISGIKFGALGGLGETRMSGEVYGLTSLEDFAGTYSATTAGISAIVGGGGVWIENDRGIKMHLKAESTGVGINLSVGTVKIKLGMVD
ncbi:MAG: hypothetical protein KAR22_12375 [Gammaproteobacteria bacterium]|nr:hypothetical protein [Gammaproteobacteria bacterium]